MATRDVHSLEIVGNLCNQPVENVLHFHADVTNEPNPLPTSHHLVDAWIAANQASFLDCLPNNYILIGYRSRRVNHTGGPHYIEITGAGTGGTQANAASNSAIAPVIISSYFDDDATPKFPLGRWNSGRLFMPGIDDNNIDDNQMSVGLQANYTTFIGLLTTPLAGGGNTFDFGVWSPGGSEFFTPVAFTVSLKMGIQGRRLKPV
jgi:hypothetical protein